MSMNKKGFTLIELMLAMTVFTLMMLVATAGFVAMNRVFIRSGIAKELSESSQDVAEDITKAIRQAEENARTCPASPPASDYEGTLIIGSTAYAWNRTGGGGMWRGPANCSVFSTEVVPSRYKVRAFEVTPIDTTEGFYRIRGVITTSEDTAINFPAATSNWFEDPNVSCKGTSEVPSAQNCAVEKFNFVVSGRG